MRRLVTILTVAMAATLLAAAGCQQETMTAQMYLAAAKKVVQEVPPQQAARELAADPSIFLLDVQDYVEYAAGHIHGAILVPRGYLEFKIAKNDLYPPINRGRVPKADQPILVYCSLGPRSVMAAKTLQEMGYSNVRAIAGGLKAWADANLPIEKRSGASAVAASGPSATP